MNIKTITTNVIMIMLLCIISVFAFNVTNRSNQVEISLDMKFENLTNISINIEDINPYKNKDFKKLKVNNNLVHFDGVINRNIKLQLNSLNLKEDKRVLMQFNKNPSKDEILSLKEIGIEISEYIGANSYYVKVSKKFDDLFEVKDDSLRLKSEKVNNKYLIKGIVEIKADYKISSKNKIKNKEPLVIKIYRDISLEEAKKSLISKHIKVMGELGSINALIVDSNSNIDELVASDNVKEIEHSVQNIGNNLEDSVNEINANLLWSGVYDLSGEGIKILQYEFGSPKNHSDFYSRVELANSVRSFQNHATHVAGILIGNGSINSSIKGIAYKGNIVSYEVDLLPLGYNYDLNQNFADGIDDYEISLISNSWGDYNCDNFGSYNSMTEDIDIFVHGSSERNGVPIIWSMGNNRTDCGYQVSSYYSTVASQASAKNVISVGNYFAGLNMTESSSSLGPTDNGRLKPEIIAPGCSVLGYIDGITSTVNTSDYDGYCGTSMAAPHVSGTVALMLQEWSSHYSNSPYPSTIKAMLIDSAKDIENDFDGGFVIDGPDYINGFGLLNAKGAVDRIRDETFIEANISNSNDIDLYAIQVNSAEDLKVTLAWDDIPGANLINDLDIKLISPKGNTFYPWHLYPGTPSADATRNVGPFLEDHDNVVEQVYITSFEVNSEGTGEWLVVVSSSALPYDEEQKYSLVTDREISTTISYVVVDPSLQAYYSFNGNTQDQTNNNHYTIVSGNPIFTEDRKGNLDSSYFFDGVDDYIGTDIDFAGFEEVSITTWVKLNKSTSNKQTYISQWLGTDNTVALLNHKDGLTYAHMKLGGSIQSVNYLTPSDYNWHHYVMTWDGNYLKLYIDSHLVGSTQTTGSLMTSTTYGTYIGEGVSSGFPNNLLKGNIDEITIWNRSLNLYEISQIYNNGINLTNTQNENLEPLESDSYLELYYDFNNDMQDESGNNLDAIGIGNPILIYDKDNNFNEAYYLDGLNDFMSTNLTVAGYEELSVSTWVKLNQSTNYKQTYISQWGAVDMFFTLLNHQTGYTYAYLRLDGSNYAVSYPTPTDYNWHHYAMTWDGNYLKLYLDGMNIGNTTTSGSLENSSIGGTYIGEGTSSAFPNNLLKGKIDEITVWSRNLSATEVRKLYSQGLVVN